MNSLEMQRLIKLEDRIYEIAREEGLDFVPIEFDIVPENKMLEIMAYGMPGQISNWKFGRDYERLKTIQEHSAGSLPMEVVITTNPARSYLMKNNTFAIQALVVAHVVGHVAFSTMNKYHDELDKDIVSKFIAAGHRFDDYERKFGIDIIEKTVDAGHSIYLHSSPFESNETEDEKRDRIFEQSKQKAHDKTPTQFEDLLGNREDKALIERDLFNHNLWLGLKNRIPVEPTEDLLRFIVDNSRFLSDWQKDILEILRHQGRYFWPHVKTKYMNEGFATYWHEHIMRKLFNEDLLNSEEHAEYNYMNSLVKAKQPFSMNPYLIGSEMWYNVVERWDKGLHGDEYDEEKDMKTKKEWDTGEMKGREKMFEIVRTHNDWFFMQNCLTNELVMDLELYLYVLQKDFYTERIVVTDKMKGELKELIIRSFAHSGIPKIKVQHGIGKLILKHSHVGMDLEEEYTQKTINHISYLWGDDVKLHTKVKKVNKIFTSIEPTSTSVPSS